MQVRPLDTIWHLAARLDGEYPRNWRLLVAMSGILDPFQVADRGYPYEPIGGRRLNVGEEVRWHGNPQAR